MKHRTATAGRMAQKTLRHTIRCDGVGLHQGAAVTMVLRPAGPDHGILFRRTDIAGRDPLVPARWDLVSDTRLCTTVSNDAGISVSTVEHLLAALAGCEIDNALIEIDGPEVPAMDGSAAPFVTRIEAAGTVEQPAPRQAIRVLKTVALVDGDRRIALSPADDFSIGFEIDFASPAVSRAALDLRLVNGTFNQRISPARTFGFAEEIDRLRAAGFARGGSLDNAVVVAGDRVLNADGLRFDDEFVRHKILDCVGDLYLAGGPMLARVDAARSGHACNNRVLRALFADPSAWARVPLDTTITAGWHEDGDRPEA